MRAQRQEPITPPTIRHIIITVEKTYASTESGVVPPLQFTLKAMHDFSPSDCLTYRFKEWTHHERGGLEFTLVAVIPPLPPSIIFGEVNETCDNAQMIRCISEHKLWEKYHVVSPPGDVYQPTQGLWLLVTSLDHSVLVSPITLLMCLENLRRLVEAEDILCFHLADIYRGKFSSQHWLQLIDITFCRQAKIHILDRLTYTPESPITALAALSKIHDWSCIHMGDRPLRRTIWEDRRALFGHLTPNPIDEHDNSAGKWLITQPKIKPNYVPWISYSNTDILQTPGTIVLCCPADLLSFLQQLAMSFMNMGKKTYFA